MKKLISTLTALTLTLSSMAALSSNATLYIYDSDSDSYNNNFEGYSRIDTAIAKSYFSYWNGLEKNDKFYSNENGTHLIATRQLSSIVVFNPADGVSEKEIRSVVWDYCDDKETDFRYTAEKRVLTGFAELDYEYEIRTSGSGSLSTSEYSVKIDEAKNICKILKEKNLISGFKYINRNQITYLDSPCKDYPMTTYTMSASELERSFLIQNFMAEHFPDCEIRVTDNGYGIQTFQFIPPNENASVEEIMEFSVKINQAYSDYIGDDKYLTSICHGTYESPELLKISDSLGSSIDMYNAVLGDANCDGSVNIADSTIILQALTNADEYSLSEQGRYNADVCGNCDGVTAEDALEIQKLDANVIDNFE